MLYARLCWDSGIQQHGPLSIPYGPRFMIYLGKQAPNVRNEMNSTMRDCGAMGISKSD